MMAALESAARSFIAPQFLWFLLLIPAVILLYLLKLRRTEVVISSTLLWLKSLHDLTANAPFQRLRKNLLLLLQLIVIALLAIALARPYIEAMGTRGSRIAVLIDRSASMQAREADGRTRLDHAKDEALAMVDRLRGGDKMMVLAFARQAQVVSEFTDDRVRLRRAIAGIVAADTATRIRDAVVLAESLKEGGTEFETIVLSDGKISDTGELGKHYLNLRFVQMGEIRDNAGIVAFSMREPSETTGERQSFVMVHNEREEPLDTTLSLYFDDALLTVETVQAGPGEQREIVFAHGSLGTGLLRAELDVDDALPVDNQAWLAVRPETALDVLLVTESQDPGAYFLRRVLSLDSRVRLSEVAPDGYAPTDDYDLTIFNGTAPATVPPGSSLFFDALPPVEGLSADGELERPPVLARDADHPVMRFLAPDNVGIARAQRLILPDGARALLSTRGGPLIADVSRGGRQTLVVAFNLADSNWPLNLSFPLFMQNVLTWVPRSALAEETSVAAGQPLAIAPDAEVAEALVRRPDGTQDTVALNPLRPVYYAATERVGAYTVTRGETAEPHAVNLLDPIESAIAPAEAIAMGRGEVLAEEGGVTQNRELWRGFVLAALAFMSVEWWLYCRRAWL